MSDKQTKCPECSTVYKVSVAQLTVAQGMVCCPKCSATFNALTNLITVAGTSAESAAAQNEPLPEDTFNTAILQSLQNAQDNESEHVLLSIFDRKVEHSNIDLKTYLNNLNYFGTEPIGNFPTLNLSDHEAEVKKQHGPAYYIIWATINFLLVGLLTFQVLWFNPNFLNNSPALSAIFNSTCQLVNCRTLEKTYSMISTNRVKVKRVSKNEVQFTGELINYHEKSLLLPNLQVTLKERGESIGVYTLHPHQYLVKSLSGIQRIPKHSPFKFEFSLPKDRKDFDSYTLEIIHP
ncbi:DUF3426 domain-containing protein [Acinetobacter sp. WCHAc010052]|uniref:DUF3426 domain-containing protein n=1 Tax=Acinetobacter sp. WCHAc010052 TaxID=2004647 RepID=UPI000B3CEB0A|nr:DUF3426 domain-containing protein [Acinetobacter sp. WCHAc010052]AXY60465.1 DUF3426 domain-containing protein [Acinetobacter sp. WCHAc010052]